MKMRMGQIGFGSAGGYTNQQSIEYDAMSTSKFYPPSNWDGVSMLFDYDVGGTFCVTATRNGSSSYLELNNNVL